MLVGGSVAFLAAATIAYLIGATIVGAALGGLVALLALVASATGLCAGCEAYNLLGPQT